MPAMQNVIINDGAATPVAHTFTPTGKDDKGVAWFEQTTPTPSTPLEAKKIGYKQIRGNTAGKVNGVSKVVYSISLPVLETLGNNSAGILPPPTLAYRVNARLEIDLPERSTKQQRKDLRSFLANFVVNAMPIANIDDLQVSY